VLHSKWKKSFSGKVSSYKTSGCFLWLITFSVTATDVAEKAGKTDVTNCKNENSRDENSFSQMPEPAAPASFAVKTEKSPLQENRTFESFPRKVVIVEPSHGEPCEATSSTGSDCGYASEVYLIDPDGGKYVFCKAHLERVLQSYNPKSYDIERGSGSMFSN